VVLAPIVENERGEFRDVIEKLRREGFVRARIDGEILELGRPEPIRLKKTESHTIEAVVDRLIVRDGVRVRLADSIDTALKWGGNRVVVLRQQPIIVGQRRRLPATESVSDALAPQSGWEVGRYSTDYGNADSGFTLGELTPKHFSFNSHFGACPACHGLGTQLVVDPELMISEPEKSIAEGVITPWRRGPKRMQAYYKKLQGALVKHFRVDEEAPFAELPEEFKSALYFGTGETPIEIKFGSNGEKIAKPFEGLVPQMQRLYEETESEFTRNRIRSFMTREPCKVCRGARLRPEILAVTISAVIPSKRSRGSELKGSAAGSLNSVRVDQLRELNIHQFTELTVDEAAQFISQIGLSAQQRQIASEVVREIESRLQFLLEVGLGYLTLDRESGTLSGGEAQRIRLATQIGSGLAGVLYVLDEPSIGLHQRDNIRLLGTLNRLRDLGNSVIVVEHDEETIRAADHIIDLGPGAGPRGGEIVAQGNLDEILRAKNSITADYLSGRARIAIPRQRVAPRSINHSAEGWLTIVGASENNLKNVNASFPLGCFICVTGVSGSGKSTLVDDILRRALFRHFYNAKEKPGVFRGLRGVDQIDKGHRD
jgi:excinuclease ABC subunit A